MRIVTLVIVVCNAIGVYGYAEEKAPAKPDPKSLSAYDEGAVDHFFLINAGVAPWGDHGSVFFHGICSLRDPNELEVKPLKLERTGPFIPPVSFPFASMLVTNDTKQKMEKSGFKGVSFRLVEKTRIVYAPWRQWDASISGEGTCYIRNGEHSPELAREMGDVWEVVLIDSAKMQHLKNAPSGWTTELKYVPGTWNGNDIFTASGTLHTYCSPRAKKWFEANYPGWTSFQDGTLH